MSDNDINKYSLIGLPELPDSVDNALKNVSDKPTSEIGSTIEATFHLVFGWPQYHKKKHDLKEDFKLEKLSIRYQKELER